MKYTHYCSTINSIKIVSVIICLFFLSFQAKAQGSEESRLYKIEQQLSLLADSISPGLKETANFSVSNIPIQDFIRGIAETHNVNVSVQPNLETRITNNFTNAKVISIFLFLAREYKLDLQIVGNIISFNKYEAPQIPKPLPKAKELRVSYDKDKDLLTADLLNDTLSNFAKYVTQLTKKNIVLSPGLGTRLVGGYIESMPLTAALDKIAYANNLRLIKTNDQAYVLQLSDQPDTYNGKSQNSTGYLSHQQKSSKPGNNDLQLNTQTGANGAKLINIDASNIAISELINEVSTNLGINYVLFSEIAGNTTLKVKNISYDDFLNFILQGTTHTYRVLDGIYTIGNRNLEGFRSTKVIKMLYRPVDRLDEVIPAELKKGVEIKIFKELNSIILSGGAPQIAEISEFLKAIDQPVVNVLIEVIVVEVRKGHTVQTGINAGLGDSIPKTGGQIFPGLDFTLSSRSINDILTKIGTRGFVNLGRVTPNFYVTLQALEQNNVLNVKSTPKLSTLNGHEANLTIGQSVFYLEQNQNITGGVTPITSITQQFKQVNADLNIKINPAVSGDNHITLDISAEFSDFVDPVVKGAPPGNATRMFTSMIRVKNEEMIVLGGLEEARNSTGSSGFPILSRIPILKWIFSSISNTKSDNRLIIFIKPTILY
jgi:type IV pilus assembly protein PilQ